MKKFYSKNYQSFLTVIVFVFVSLFSFSGTASADVLSVTNISPNTGINTGGTNITITGTGFTASSTVTVGGIPATNINIVNNTTITATTPAGASGLKNVVVSNPTSINFSDIGSVNAGSAGIFYMSIAVSNDGNYAYVTNEYDLTFREFNISNHSSAPVAVGSPISGPAPQQPISVVLSSDGHYAYVTIVIQHGGDFVGNDSVIQAYDVSDHSVEPVAIGSPVSVGDSNSWPNSIAISNDNNYLYLIDGNGFLRVYDISNHSIAPVAINATSTDGYAPNFVALSKDGNYAYVGESHGILQEFDISNHSIAPVAIGSVSTAVGGDWPNSLVISNDGNYIYIIDGDGGTLQVFNASNHSSAPVAVGSPISTGGTWPTSIAISSDSNYVFITDKNFSIVNAFDISNRSAAPVAVGSINTGYELESVALSSDDNYAYVVGNNTLQGFSISKLTPTATSTFTYFTDSPIISDPSTPTTTTAVTNSSSGSRAPCDVLIKIFTPSASTTEYLKSLGCVSNDTKTKIISAIATSSVFFRDLSLGSEGADVKALQQYLNTHGYIISKSGVGSVGNESTSFGTKTKLALMKFQKANDIPSTGFFGPITRAYVQGH